VKGANDRLTPADVDAAGDLLRTTDCIILQLEIPIETVYHTLRFGRQHSIRTILNPAPAQPLDLKEITNADYLIPNETEAEVITGMPVGSLKEARAAAIKLLGDHPGRVIITLGENGALYVGPDNSGHIPGHGVKAIDTTGAGDAFIGSFATFLGGGATEREAIARANVYAALSTLAIGTQMSFPTPEQFEAAWSTANA